MIMPEKNIKAYFQDGIRFKRGKKRGVPAQTIVNIFIEIVLNLIALFNKKIT